jgi:hypothetical protein
MSMASQPQELIVLFDSFGTPKYVVRKNQKRSGMTAVLSPGDSVKWIGRPNTEFEIEFVDQLGQPVESPLGWGANVSKKESDSNGEVSGTVPDPPAPTIGVVYKYNVWGPSGQVLDPEIIIER